MQLGLKWKVKVCESRDLLLNTEKMQLSPRIIKSSFEPVVFGSGQSSL
jgi:hypothetical protein